ncbi:MAG: hypothetical protein HQK79_22295 [Desulfobacterales bacterium]|nr:hypothetical protein [Desulfobacterales bacterium]MBF0396532.1 hypothetical protein [Desulfobacterales bacterium]
MLKKLGIAGKFIIIISIVTIIFLSIIGFVIITTAKNSNNRLLKDSISLFNLEQNEETKLLKKMARYKGEAIASLLSYTSAGVIVGFDFDKLKQISEDAIKDSDISFITFYDDKKKIITSIGDRSVKKEMEIINKKIMFGAELVGFIDIGLNFDIVKKNQVEIADRINKMIFKARNVSNDSIKDIIKWIAFNVGLIVLALCISIFGAVSYIVIKPIYKIVYRLNKLAEKVSFLSSHVNLSSQESAEGASRTGASLEKTSTSMEEISTMTKHSASNADTAKNLVKDTDKLVKNANDAMTRLTFSMQDITKASEESSLIVKTIDEIAFQTNLLSLNAAVEAARAGAAGAGFGVVADEVRRLALRTAQAAQNTSSLIEETIKRISEGAAVVNLANQAFLEVTNRSSKISELVEEIATASNYQAKGIEEVNGAVLEMFEVNKQHAANSEESAKSSETMSRQAIHLKKIVEYLIILIRGK